jgi:hypothetical protein
VVIPSDPINLLIWVIVIVIILLLVLKVINRI